MVFPRFSLVCLVACLSSRVEAFGLLPSRGLVSSRHTSAYRPHSGRSSLVQGRSMAMQDQTNPREDADFETTVDWDEELRKLNASQYGKRQTTRDLSESKNDPEVVKWAKNNAAKAKSSANQASSQARKAMRKAPRWQQLSRDYRFWLGLVVGVSLLASIIGASDRSQGLVVLNDALDDSVEGGGVNDAFAYAVLMAATTAHVAGAAASQLAESGAANVIA